MIRNKGQVEATVKSLRSDAQDYFIPLGGRDTSTESKKDISNLSQTLANHVPLVEAFVKAAAPYPVYVGYDGQDYPDRAGSYYRNLVLLHQAADESSEKFILAYIHELTHMHQDRKGLLRMDEVPPPEQFLDFLAHNLMLEAAALATEVSCMYYLSRHSRLAEEFDEVEEMYDDYISQNQGRAALYCVVDEAAAKKKIKSFDDMKPVWKAVFQQFFAPDSVFMTNYVSDFCDKYMVRLEEKAALSKKPWGGDKELAAITTMPGWGRLFGAEGVEILQGVIRGALLQDKFLPLIDMTRRTAERQHGVDNRLIQALLRMK
jgi:hypothetical protein